jgi:hypothetical protein
MHSELAVGAMIAAPPARRRSGEKRKGGLPYMPDILERISRRSSNTSIFYYF